MDKTIIFGFDGTIVDSRSMVINLYNEVAEKSNFKKINKDEIEYLSALGMKDRCKFLNIPFIKIPFVVLEVTKRYRSYITSLVIQEGLKDVLYKIKEKGCNLVIISSNSTNNINKFLENNGIKIFDSIYSSRNLFGKHYVINRFLKKYNLKKDNVIYVGGQSRDIDSCRKIQLKIAAVGWGYDSLELLRSKKPDYIITDSYGLLDLID